jgi:integrase
MRTLNRLPPKVATATLKPGMHADGGGLYLRVKKEKDGSAGSRQWVFVFQWRGKRRELGLGGVNKVSLATAREKALKGREALGQGRDPILERQAERALPTFGEEADAWIEAREASVRNSKSVDRWKRILGEGGAADALRTIRIDHVTTDHVLDVLKPIWEKGPTATLARGYIEAVLDAATAKKLRKGENPARWRGHLETLLPKAQKLARGHHAALDYRDVPEFMAALRAKDSTVARLLEFTILTWTRAAEPVGATWQEIDLDAGLWVIPAARTKTAKEHRVPLSPRGVAILRKLKPKNVKPGALVFGEGGKPASNMATTMLLRRMGYTGAPGKKPKATVHGFRSTSRDYAADVLGTPREIAEAALAHTLGGVEAAYRRGDALEKRRALMKDWASFCAGERPLGKVIPMGAGRRAGGAA